MNLYKIVELNPQSCFLFLSALLLVGAENASLLLLSTNKKDQLRFFLQWQDNYSIIIAWFLPF
jgi:hypothetical protein